MNYRESLITAETSYSPTKPYLPTYLLTYIHRMHSCFHAHFTMRRRGVEVKGNTFEGLKFEKVGQALEALNTF